MKEKTATSGVRYKINDLEFIKKKERLNTLQEVVYFLMSEYLKLYKVEKVSIFSAPKDVYDGPRLPNNFTHDEPPMFSTHKPKLILRSGEQWQAFKRECNNIEEWEELKQQIIDAPNLSPKQIQLIINTP